MRIPVAAWLRAAATSQPCDFRREPLPSVLRSLRGSIGAGGGCGRRAFRAVALLVFLAAAAGAGVVAADFLAADHLLGFGQCAGTRARHPHFLLLAPLAPLV